MIEEKGKLNRAVARYFSIKRFSLHDGEGIRTSVYLSGCPLRCVWCHNPEGFSYKSQVAYFSHKCISCGECVSVCNAGAHSIVDGKHFFDREKCITCGKCESACLGLALQLYGKEISVEELLSILLEDRAFYDVSNGGVTLSGGECLFQFDFCLELAKRLKIENISLDIDTCGYTEYEKLRELMPYVDTFLYDLKAFNSKTHIRYTGVDNQMIKENLQKLCLDGAKVEVRVPYIPDCNDGELLDIAEFLKGLNIVGVRILPYHNFAVTKYEALGCSCEMPATLPTEEALNSAKEIFSSKGIYVIA